MGTLSGHVNDSYDEKARERCNAVAGGNMSRYVGDLIRADVDGAPTPTPGVNDADCLINVCKEWAPAYVTFMKERVDGVDQRIMLESIVRLIALGQIGLRDEWAKSQWPLKAADEGAKYNED